MGVARVCLHGHHLRSQRSRQLGEPLSDDTVDYYQRRANEYDATSWASLPAVNTLDVGCGTGYVSRWLPGHLTLMDTSPAILSIARRRLPDADFVQARTPPLPLLDSTFGRAFTANFYGHLAQPQRSELVTEMLRVAAELVVLEHLSNSGSFSEGPEERRLIDGSRFSIHKCYSLSRGCSKNLEAAKS